MKNIALWHPSKFVYQNGKLRASRDPKEVGISSRFVADIVANHYDTHLKSHVSGRLIDLGCGKVPLYHSYKDFATACFCADWKSSIHQNPYLDFTCDLNAPLPFSPQEFNTIILSDVLEHIERPENLWQEMFKVLQPGGKVILNVPFFYKLHEIPHDYFRYTKYALLNFASSSGFNVILIKELGGLPEILTDLTAKFLFSIPFVGKYLAIAVQSVSGFFLRTGIGKRITAKTQEHYPLGYFMVVQK
jgi:SAM-dependent methyltransferase